MPMRLFEDLRDGQIDKKDEFKNHARFKSDLSGIKTSGKKSADQKNTVKNVSNLFDLRQSS